MPTAAERARAAFDELERNGVQPLDDTYWMNPEDKDAICHPFVAAILAAERDAAARAREATLDEAARKCREVAARFVVDSNGSSGAESELYFARAEGADECSFAIRALKSQPPKGGQ